MSPFLSRNLTFVFFGLATMAWAIWVNPDGYFVDDEAIYHMTAVSLISDGNLFVWNGYEEYPSPELLLSHLRVHNGHLYPQYPVFFSVIAYPFVSLLGFKGLYLLNALSVLATVVICYRLAKFLFRDFDLATNACLIFLFATYAWESGQAAWPHGVSMLLVTLSAYLACLAYHSPRAGASTMVAAGAGLVVGLGIGVRLDTILALPAIVIPFLFARPCRIREAVAMAAGLIPALVVLAVTNHLKFGILSPLSYGRAPNPDLAFESYLWVAIIGVIGLAVAWLGTRRSGQWGGGVMRLAVVGGLLLFAGLGLALPQLWDNLSGLASGAYHLLVDYGIGETEDGSRGVILGPGGEVKIAAGIRKSLLQSCPYLAMLAIPIAALFRGGEDRGRLGILFLIPVAFVTVYAYFTSFGGGGLLNPRHLLPVLPFTSILVAWAWRELNRGLTRQSSLPRLGVAAATTAVFLALMVLSETTGGSAISFLVQEIKFRAIPLVLFALGLGLVTIVVVSREASGSQLRAAVSLLFVTAFVWSGLTAFNHDYFRAYAFRQARVEVTARLARVMEPDSILFTNAPNSFHRLLLDRRIRIAAPWRDEFQDFHALRTFHSQRGRAVYVWLDPGMEEAVRARRLFDNLDTIELFTLPGRGRLVQLIARTEAG